MTNYPFTFTEEDSNFIIIQSLKHYNFSFIENNKLICQQSLFYFYCKYDYYFIVESILKNIDININKRNADEVINKNYYKLTGPNFDFDSNTPLTISAQKENNEILKLLLKKKIVDVNALCEYTIFRNDMGLYSSRETERKTVFHIAIEKGNVDLIKLLMDIKDLDVNKDYTFVYSSYIGYDDISDILNKMDDNFSNKWPPYESGSGWFVYDTYKPRNTQPLRGYVKQEKINALYKVVKDRNIEIS